jgi:HlyD family secretion protein
MSASNSLTLLRGKAANFDAPDAVLEYEPASKALMNAPVQLLARRVSWVISSLVLICIVILAVYPIDRVVSSPGRVVSLSPTTVLQPLDTSIVRSINVHEGEVVHPGELLARLDPTFTGSDEAQYEAQVRSYGAEVARAQAELANQDYNPTSTDVETLQQRALFVQRKAALDAQMSEYQQKIASLEQTAQRAETDMAGYRERLGIATDVASMRKQLEGMKVGSRLNTLSAEDTKLEMMRMLAYNEALARSSKSDLMAMLHERDYTLQNANAQTSSELTDASRKLSDAQEALVKARLRHKLVEWRADQDATVQWVAKVSVGSVLGAGEQLMQLIPNNTQFAVDAKIPGDEIGFVRPGQKVRIKLETLYTNVYGFADGTVQTVSPDSFMSADAGTTSAAQRSASGLSSSIAGPPPEGKDDGVGYYRAKISIDKTEFRNLPPEFHFMPGMALTADIEVGKRTVMTYFLSRTIPVFSEAMREP